MDWMVARQDIYIFCLDTLNGIELELYSHVHFKAGSVNQRTCDAKAH